MQVESKVSKYGSRYFGRDLTNIEDKSAGLESKYFKHPSSNYVSSKLVENRSKSKIHGEKDQENRPDKYQGKDNGIFDENPPSFVHAASKKQPSKADQTTPIQRFVKIDNFNHHFWVDESPSKPHHKFEAPSQPTDELTEIPRHYSQLPDAYMGEFQTYNYQHGRKISNELPEPYSNAMVNELRYPPLKQEMLQDVDSIYKYNKIMSFPGNDFFDFNGIPYSHIWSHLIFRKNENICQSPYLNNQPDLTTDMREIVVDWLVDVHRKFKMRTETLFLAVTTMDRYLEKNEIKKEIFQLVAATCLFIAAKYEEIYPPAIEDYVYICAETYSKKDFIGMESMILAEVGFNLVVSSQITLLGIYSAQSKSRD